MKKISLGSWAFTYGPYEEKPISFKESARYLSNSGYDGIEIGGFPPHITLERYPNTKTRRPLKSFLDDLNLAVSGYAADFGFLDPTILGNRENYLDLFTQFIDLCVDISSPVIRVDVVATPESIQPQEYENSLSTLTDIWRNCAEVAEKANVLVVWEFEPAFAFNKPSEIITVVNKVDHPNFKLLFDTSHAYMCGVIGARQMGKKEILAGGETELFDMLKENIGHIHLIDSDGTLYNNDTSTHAPFGYGKVDFQSLVPRFQAMKDIEWYCIDLCFWPGAWELVEPSLLFLRDLFKP
ncbi:sugar phosphate isomerase/epimerase family protein [Chloroflexota bacterium]